MKTKWTERLDLLGNPYHRKGFCRAMMKAERCYGHCEKCPLQDAVNVQGYGKEKAHKFRGSKKYDFGAMLRESTRY